MEDVEQRQRFFLGSILRLKNYVWWKIMFTTTFVTICPKIKDLKPKCGKWGLPRRIKNCDFRCGYYTGIGHIENKCWKKKKEVKSHSTTNNYMELLVDDEVATLEHLNRLCGTKHDFFLDLKGGC